MASPVLESFCCMPLFNESDMPKWNDSSVMFNYSGLVVTYNTLCIMSSSLSVCGAFYQLLPRHPSAVTLAWSQLKSILRQNAIICYLAIADLLASAGVLMRSSLWISGKLPYINIQGNGTDDFAHVFCAASSAWIQYFYICTYFWTFIYAVDVLLLTLKKPGPTVLYHVISWGVSAFICAVGLIFLYYPSNLRCADDIPSLLPHYLSSYLPMCLVMVANPFIYYKASNAVKSHFYSSGIYAHNERRIVDATNSKFRQILFAFYICWTANIVNGIVLLIKHFQPLLIPKAFDYTVWHLMAVMNPLQAFLNSVIYRGVGLCYQRCNAAAMRPRNDSDEFFAALDAADYTSRPPVTNTNETSPLLQQF